MKAVRGTGPIPARLMICGEAPGAEEERLGTPFVGASGHELDRLLHEAGIMRHECYVTNVSKFRPLDNYIGHFFAKAKKDIGPQHTQMRGKWVTKEISEGYAELLQEIEMVKPNLIIPVGNVALWALTGEWGVAKWRGSQLKLGDIRVLPTIHPAAILREWSYRPAVLSDLKRASRFLSGRGDYNNMPNWQFQLGTSFEAIRKTVQVLLGRAEVNILWLDLDIETVSGHIDCIGVGWSRTEAICIPLMKRGNWDGFWSLEEETQIVWWLKELLTHKNVRVRWQNGLYDAQYIHRHWGFIPRHGQDTMITQHSCFAALPKGLGYLGSLYADYYVYWKDEGKVVDVKIPEEQRWTYNCKDLVYTREVGEVLEETKKKLGLAAVDEIQQSLFHPVLNAMIRGVRVRPEIKSQMAMDIQEELSAREAFLYQVLGHEINHNSPKQMQALFYEDLQQPIIKNRVMIAGKTVMRPSCDDEALNRIAQREPLLKPITNAIADIRTLEKFMRDFVLMKLDTDGRMRCSFNIAGDAGGKSAPYSYRLSSSKNAFGSGGNLQTIPSEKSKSSGKAAARGSMDFTLPNIRSMFGPDPGFTFFDMDLDRADLQVVAWEADDPLLKQALKLGVDIHLLNVYAIDNQEPPPLDELVEGHPKYLDHRGPRKYKREFSKVFAHATDYLGKPRTVAAHTGRTVHEIERAQANYFGRYPGIKKWQERVIAQVRAHRFVENRLGYRWYIFDRIDDSLMPEAVAWIPQSTVGNVINRIWLRFWTELPEVQVLLQVHDSLAGQFPTHRKEILRNKMIECSKIIVPYDDPLIIPAGIKTSEISWGDCA